MEFAGAIDALQALGHEHRLRVFRILVRWGETGLSAGAIAQALGLSPSNLSFHLNRLQRARLVRASRVGRRVLYSIDQAGTREVFAYLTEDCCHGNPELCAMPPPDRENRRGGNTMAERGERRYQVMFLCTGNSARSIMAECILNRLGRGRFQGYSAGSHPKGEVHPFALRLLRKLNYETSALRSKSWDEFAGAGAPALDFVFTVCDRAAAEVCPVWPGQPMTAHWGVPDPADAAGNEAQIAAAFADVYRMLGNRIDIFVNLPLVSLEKFSLQRSLERIGAGEPAAPPDTALSGTTPG